MWFQEASSRGLQKPIRTPHSDTWLMRISHAGLPFGYLAHADIPCGYNFREMSHSDPHEKIIRKFLSENGPHENIIRKFLSEN